MPKFFHRSGGCRCTHSTPGYPYEVNSADRLTSVPQSLTVLQSARETKDQDDDENDAEDDTENEEHGAATARRQVNISSSSYRQHSVIVRVGMVSRCDEQWRVCVVGRSRRVDRRCAGNNTFSAATVFCCVAYIYIGLKQYHMSYKLT